MTTSTGPIGYVVCPVHGTLVEIGTNLRPIGSCPSCWAEATEAEAKLVRDRRSGQAVDTGGAEEA